MALIQALDPESEDIRRRGRDALAGRRARGEIMTFVENGWVLREYPGRRVERLCRVADFLPENFEVAG